MLTNNRALRQWLAVAGAAVALALAGRVLLPGRGVPGVDRTTELPRPAADLSMDASVIIGASADGTSADLEKPNGFLDVDATADWDPALSLIPGGGQTIIEEEDAPSILEAWWRRLRDSWRNPANPPGTSFFP